MVAIANTLSEFFWMQNKYKMLWHDLWPTLQIYHSTATRCIYLHPSWTIILLLKKRIRETKVFKISSQFVNACLKEKSAKNGRTDHTVLHVKLEKISLFASCQRGGFCLKPFRDIYFVHQHSNPGRHFEHDKIFPFFFNGFKSFIRCITFCRRVLWTLCWLSKSFPLDNSIEFTLFNENDS